MHKQMIPGIIGGMGPEATIDLMYRIYNNTPATEDGEHLRILIDNNAKVPSRIKAIIEGTGESPAPCLISMAQGLVQQGADFLVIPCNTAHYYFDQVSASVDVPVVNLLEITAQTLKNNNMVKVGILGSTALSIVGLYNPVFEKFGLNPVYPEELYQDKLMEVIKAVKAKNITQEHLSHLSDLLQHMEARGIDCFAIVCTELSVIRNKILPNVKIFDALEILTDEIIKRSMNNN
ncbi:amino acid racemase [Vibrio sp. 1-Bac 57]